MELIEKKGKTKEWFKMEKEKKKKKNIDFQAALVQDKMDASEDDAICRAFDYDTDEEAEEAYVKAMQKKRKEKKEKKDYSNVDAAASRIQEEMDEIEADAILKGILNDDEDEDYKVGEDNNLTPYYFAYGSNMDEARLKERLYNFGHIVLGKGVLKGYSLKFDKVDYALTFCGNLPLKQGVGHANIAPDKNSVVEGVVFKLDDLPFGRLDHRMGLDSGQCYRKLKQIETEKGTIECWVYKAVPNRVKKGLKPTKEGLGHMLAAKKYFSKEYCNKLSKTVTIDQNKKPFQNK